MTWKEKRLFKKWHKHIAWIQKHKKQIFNLQVKENTERMLKDMEKQPPAKPSKNNNRLTRNKQIELLTTITMEDFIKN